MASKTRSQAWERGLVWDRFCWSVAQVALFFIYSFFLSPAKLGLLKCNLEANCKRI